MPFWLNPLLVEHQHEDWEVTGSNYNLHHCVVPENIHTPTTEGVGNSRGVGGSKAQEIPEEWGG